jgi:hypothetical protein
MRVLHEQENIVDVSAPTLLDQLTLECQRFRIRNQPQAADD